MSQDGDRHMDRLSETTDQTTRQTASCPEKRPVHDALHLTEGGPLAEIRLRGQVYTLRITRHGKLILTK